MRTEAQMRRRMERVRVLLESHDEPYERELSRGERSFTGFAESRWISMVCGYCAGADCERCRASREVRANDLPVIVSSGGDELAADRAARERERSRILSRGGRAYVRERDAMDNGQKGFWAGVPAKTMDDRQVERELRKLREDELKREGVIANIAFETSLIQAEQRDKRGDYELLRTVVNDHMPRHLRGERAIRWLAEHLPGPIRIPRWAFERELLELDEEIRQWKEQGANENEIAVHLGISRRQVKSSLRRTRKS